MDLIKKRISVMAGVVLSSLILGCSPDGNSNNKKLEEQVSPFVKREEFYPYSGIATNLSDLRVQEITRDYAKSKVDWRTAILPKFDKKGRLYGFFYYVNEPFNEELGEKYVEGAIRELEMVARKEKERERLSN